MASSGSITNQFRTGYKIRLNWSVTSQSTANNTSTMSVTAQLISDGSSYNINAGTLQKAITITVNGTNYNSTASATLTGGQTKDLYTVTGIVVPHNSDGSKTVSMSCSFAIAVTLSGTYWGTVSCSGSGVLNTIARASSCSFPSMTMNSASTITITRADSSFTHTVQYYFGSASGTITTKTTGTSVSWTPPLSLGNQIPNTSSGTGTLRLITYNSGGTEIGRKDYTLNLSIPNTYKPTISSITTAVSVASINTQFAGYVKGKTGVTTTINVSTSNAYGATVASYKTTILGTTYSGQTTTSGYLAQAGTVTISCTITDSRGNPHTLTKDIVVQDYANPNISLFTVSRNATTETTLNCTYSFAVSSVGSKNTRALSYRSRVAGGTWGAYTAITLSAYTGTNGTFNITGASAESSYEVELKLSDYFSSTVKTYLVSTAFVTLDFLNGGKGIAIGKVAESTNLLDVDMNSRFRKQVTINSPYLIMDTTSEKQIRFQNAGSNQDLVYLYGGATSSGVIIGVWDNTKGRMVWSYTTDGNFNIARPTNISDDLIFNTTGTTQRIRFKGKSPSSWEAGIFGGGSSDTAVLGIFDWTNSRDVFTYKNDGNLFAHRPLYAISERTGGSSRVLTHTDFPNRNEASGFQVINKDTILQWGRVTTTANASSTAVTFPVAFSGNLRGIHVTGIFSNYRAVVYNVADYTLTGFSVYPTIPTSGAVPPSTTIAYWFAYGDY